MDHVHVIVVPIFTRVPPFSSIGALTNWSLGGKGYRQGGSLALHFDTWQVKPRIIHSYGCILSL